MKELYSLSYHTNTLYKLCAVQMKHIFTMREDVQYEVGTSLNGTGEDVQYKSGISSVQAKMCSTSK